MVSQCDIIETYRVATKDLAHLLLEEVAVLLTLLSVAFPYQVIEAKLIITC